MKKSTSIGLSIIIFIIFMSSALLIGRSSDFKKTKEITNKLLIEMNNIKHLPDSNKTLDEPDMIVKPSHGCVTYHFYSDQSYNIIKGYYFNEANRLGWNFVSEENLKTWGHDYGEKCLTWKRSNYTLTLSYAGDNTSLVWKFSISVSYS